MFSDHPAASGPSRTVPALDTHLIINRAGGSALGLDPEELGAEIADIFGRAGWAVATRAVAPQQLADALAEAVGDPATERVIVGGGDGTVLAAARLLVGSRRPLGIVPLGTMNMLARDLGIPLKPREAAEALTGGAPRAIDCAYVNDRLFLCSCRLGLPTRLTLGRQRLRGKPPLERLVGYWRLLRRIASATRKVGFVIDDGRTQRRVRALCVVVSNNAYGGDPGLVLRKQSLDRGELGLYISRHRNGLAMVGAYLAASCGLWRGETEFEHMAARHIRIDTAKRRVLATLDGEAEELVTPLVFRSEPQSLTVIAPQQEAAR